MYNAVQYSQLRLIVFVHIREGLFIQENPWIYEKRFGGKKERKGPAEDTLKTCTPAEKLVLNSNLGWI